jgi:DNA-binding SARP family transcriptional activator/ABC-type branched-subunit amino acid transport system substrate-binding protein/DNA-binding beta-propeller fold protein YncE
VLAILLLHANEVVSTGRLIDELWGDERPDDAQTALQQHVSRLRRLFEPGDVVATQAPGYVLRVEQGRLDLLRFEELGAEGRRRLDAGEFEAAAELLREALALWRGPALADLQDEPFAAHVVPRLEEARLVTLESRLDADLALGRDAELVPELRELCRLHGLRERLRGQLMLALYRSGRQAEALDEYAAARRTLVAELGLEPGPELRRLQARILAQDPALELERRRPSTPGRRRRAPIAVAAGIAAVAGSAVALALALRSGGEAGAEPSGGAVAVIDPRTGELRHRIDVGSTPSAVAVGEGAVWVVDADDRTVSRIDPDSHDVSTFGTGSTPTDIAVGEGSVWVGDGEELASAQFVGPVATGLTRLDPSTRAVRARVGLPAEGGAIANLVEDHLAVAAGGVWAVTPESALVRVDPASNAVSRPTRPLEVAAVAAAGDAWWALGGDGTIARLDSRSGALGSSMRLELSSTGSLAAGGGSAWVTSPLDGTLWRVQPGARLFATAIPVGRGVTDVAYGEGALWVVNPVRGQLLRVDPRTNSVDRRLDLGGIPRAVAVGQDGVWVTIQDAASSPAADGDVEGVTPMPSSFCGPVFAGSDDAARRLLIVSDLPLQGGDRVPTSQMAQAIALVLRRHGFKAGRWDVAYQSCDDSVARTGLYDPAKCAANARAYVRNDDVAGVIGTFNSDCALTALPELNPPRGSLAMVSPSNSYVGLTRAGPGTRPGELTALYPTGRRNYVRVSPTGDLQAAALAQLLQGLGRRRVYVLHDGQPLFGRADATAFARAARRSGLRVVGTSRWDPHARRYAGLAAAVARSGADAVFLGGLIDSHGPEVVRDLRARLGRRVAIAVTDGFTPVSGFLARAGDAGRGVYISTLGLVEASYGPVAERFVRDLSATLSGARVEPAAVYAAQAAEVLLDAISRSDGTRGSIVRALFATRLRGSLLGDVSFDRNGDLVGSPITIVRAERGGGSTNVQSVDGADVYRVIRPSLDLVR